MLELKMKNEEGVRLSYPHWLPANTELGQYRP
jgi:hypothetical protein